MADIGNARVAADLSPEQKEKAWKNEGQTAARRSCPTGSAPTQADQLKKQYGTIHELSVTHGPVDPKHPDKAKRVIAYLRNPSVSELDMVMSSIGNSPISTKLTMAKTIYIGGDENFINIITEGHQDFNLQTAFRVAQFVEQITGVGLGEFRTL